MFTPKDTHSSKANQNQLEMPSSEGPLQAKSLTPPAFQLKASPAESEEVESAGLESASETKQLVAGESAASSGASSAGGGNGLPGDLRASMEQMSGTDMSDVKVHMNSDKPKEVGALAYAQGSDIHVAPGQEEHLPHEAWHTVQQKQGRVAANTNVNGMAVNDQTSLESEADSMGAKAAQMKADPTAISQMKEGAGGSTASKTIQKVDPAPTDLLAEYQGWTSESLKRDISGNIYDSIQTVQSIRIASWLGNAGIEETRPGALLLGIALDILSAGIGGALGGIIERGIASAITGTITQEFINGLAGQTLDMVREAATNGLKGLANPASQDSSSAASRGVAITAQNGLAQYYTEGANLLLLDAKTNNVSRFNGASAGYNRNQLMLMHKGLKKTYETLRDDPSAFMQSLTVGYMKLRDEIFLHDASADSAGSTEAAKRATMYSESGTVDEANERSGNMVILGPIGSIGDYSSPHFSVDRANVSGLNAQTRQQLGGLKIKDMPFSLAFRFWGSTPNAGLFSDPLCKVWFTKRPDGTIAVDSDQNWERDSNGWDGGREWLARYDSGISGDMDEDMIHAHQAAGARKVYDHIKNMSIPAASIMNLDMF